MQILIDFYKLSRTLLKPFRTARGEISKKEVLILLFDKKFALELPLAPSNGEMPGDVLHFARKGELSNMSRRGLTYYLGMTDGDFHLPIVKPLKTFDTRTYDINTTEYSQGNVLHRLKGSRENLEHLFNFSKNAAYPWTVDFNAGLSRAEFENFLSIAELKNCLFIEQPMQDDEPLPRCPVPIWVDEGLKKLTPNSFLESPFAGFMLKPLNHDFKDFLQWIMMARNNKIPFFISGVVCDNVYFQFLKTWNQASTWQNIYAPNAGFFSEELPLNESELISELGRRIPDVSLNLRT